MKKGKRYEVSHLEEAQFEPGSRRQVLKNLLGIKTKRVMDAVEEREQFRALEELIRLYGPEHRFTTADICNFHKIWLGPIYSWAGQYRQVNLTKGDFPFAAAGQIPRLMAEFERGPLRQFTPCRFASRDDMARALAVVHTEFILIHPFREGNGRVARLLAHLMAAQAGLPLLNFSDLMAGRKRQAYFAAVRAGLDRNYAPMEEIFSDLIDRALQARPPSQPSGPGSPTAR